MNLSKIKKIVLGTLGKEKFAYDTEGRISLTEDDKAKLTGVFGEEFVTKFTSNAESEELENDGKELLSLISDHNNKVIAKEIETKLTALEAKMAVIEGEQEKAQAQLMEKEAEVAVLKEQVKVLSEEPEKDLPETQGKPSAQGGKVVKFKANPKHYHNQMANEFLKGDSSKAILSQSQGFVMDVDHNRDIKAEGIDAAEIKSEFGTYLSQEGFDILKLLTQPVESVGYMTTKLAITEWRASKANMGSVVQQFIAKWTPSGEAEFTPLTVKNYRHKVNLPITPDDINDSWLSYLYNESMTPDQMPITKYIIQELLVPRVDADRELLLLGKGHYVALGAGVSTGDPGQATGLSMDGFLTIIAQQEALGAGSKMNFYAPVTEYDGAGVNKVTWMEDFAKWIKAQNMLYAMKGMNIFCAPEVVEAYNYKYRDMFPTTKNQDGKKNDIDFTNFTLIPLPSMIGSRTIFATPKENFIHLKHINTAASKVFLQVDDYDVKVFAEWWEGVGFAIAELVFAYCPGDGSGSGSGS
jgi:hypothetical protein